MSMEALTIMQFFEILAAYLCLTFLLPAMLFRRKLKSEKFSVRFMTYQVIGNFYVMNLVFLLQLLRISNRVTLVCLTFGPFLAAYIRLNGKHPLLAVKNALYILEKIADGRLGVRLYFRRLGRAVFRRIKSGFRTFFSCIGRNLPDLILFLILTGVLVWAYGINLVRNFGYCASDIPVHNYWINAMEQNDIFVAGIYPYGFHCVIYYIYTVFGIPVYVLLRIFCFVQTLMIHYCLLAFGKSCCKTRFAAYAGTFLYAASAIFSANTYTRYFSSLPQEFGMLFILPSAYYLFALFEKKEKRLREEKWNLICFAFCFSMTISVHFYNAMIAGMFCLGIAVGYCFRLFRKRYFGRVMLTGFASIFIAILPMAVAFAMGTPLQGSLGWGLNVIKGAESEAEAPPSEMEDDLIDGTESAGGAGTSMQIPENGVSPSGEDGAASGSAAQQKKEKPSLTEKLIGALKRIPGAVWEVVSSFLIPGNHPFLKYAVPGGIFLLTALSLIFFLLKQPDYGAKLLSTAAFLAFLSALLGASEAGLPELMDTNRTSIFYAYSLVMAWSMCIDGVLQLFMGWAKRKWPMHLVSFVAAGAVLAFAAREDVRKELPDFKALQTNEAVTCLTNILAEEKDFSWTICSANDELRMGEAYGYHYEIHPFLRSMERIGSGANIIIPTLKVYFFIEKIPIDYGEPYEGSGSPVSKEGAKRPIPVGSGISMYQGEKRWIEMSRMYYWAQAFQKLYPNEMRVYYETDRFLCYCIEQDLYSPINFAIDYGYNMTGRTSEGNE